jgi:hypothetical protein
MATKWYLTNRAAPYTPATIQGAWDDSAGAVTKALDTIKAGGGATTTVARAEVNNSNTYDVLLYRGISGPLASQTINCNVNVCIGAKEASAAAADFYWHVHLYVTTGDSDTPRVTLLTDYVENTTNEFPTTATFLGLQSAQAVNQTISAGDRLVLEIGIIARNASTTSYTATLNYGSLDGGGTELADGAATGTDVTSKAGWISFSSDVTEATPLTAKIPQESVRTISLGAPVAKVAHASVRTLSGTWDAAGLIAQLSVRTLSTSSAPPPTTTFPALMVAM